MTITRRPPAKSSAILTRHALWPLVRASVDKDERTVIFTTEEIVGLNGAMATCASADEALALAQFVNRQGCFGAPSLFVTALQKTTSR